MHRVLKLGGRYQAVGAAALLAVAIGTLQMVATPTSEGFGELPRHPAVFDWFLSPVVGSAATPSSGGTHVTLKAACYPGYNSFVGIETGPPDGNPEYVDVKFGESDSSLNDLYAMFTPPNGIPLFSSDPDGELITFLQPDPSDPESHPPNFEALFVIPMYWAVVGSGSTAIGGRVTPGLTAMSADCYNTQMGLMASYVAPFCIRVCFANEAAANQWLEQELVMGNTQAQAFFNQILSQIPGYLPSPATTTTVPNGGAGHQPPPPPPPPTTTSTSTTSTSTTTTSTTSSTTTTTCAGQKCP